MAMWRRFACWISKATRSQAHASARAPKSTHAQARTHTYTEKYVRLIAFLQQKCFLNAPQYYVIR